MLNLFGVCFVVRPDERSDISYIFPSLAPESGMNWRGRGGERRKENEETERKGRREGEGRKERVSLCIIDFIRQVLSSFLRGNHLLNTDILASRSPSPHPIKSFSPDSSGSQSTLS